MPELPEVETTRRGLDRRIVGRRVVEVVVRERRLRWPVPSRLARELPGEVVERTSRRAKYLLIHCSRGTVIVHLGMSGSLQVVDVRRAPGAHDHVDLVFDDEHALRLRDPRRFGAVLWTTGDPHQERLLAHLGPEPLSCNFDGAYLHAVSRGRRVSIKKFVMDASVVVGVGNIYASEALFVAGVHPHRAAGRVGGERCEQIARAVKEVLGAAIERGGTTLRDYAGVDGRAGENGARLAVYGREGEGCVRCGGRIRLTRRGDRATYHCPGCQR